MLHLNDYSDQEYIRTFYQPEDYQKFTESSVKIVKHLKAKTPKSQKLCTRGLERYTVEASSLISERRDMAKDIVFAYQKNPEYMAKILASHSSTSQMEAQLRGLDDATCAMK